MIIGKLNFKEKRIAFWIRILTCCLERVKRKYKKIKKKYINPLSVSEAIGILVFE